MRLRTPLLALAVCALALCAAARAQDEQRKDQQVIDDFIVTRGMSLDPPGKQKQKQTKPAPGKRSSAKNRKPAAGDAAAGKGTAGKDTAGKGGAAAKSNGAAATAPAPSVGAAGDGAKFARADGRALSLGYTVFLKQTDVLSYADPSREFRTGDRIAIAFESNADGYLYLFNSSGDAKTPDMIFPSASIDGGANALGAHTYATFPAEANASFRFTDPPGTERLFVVFSRRPLALVEFCRGQGEDCVWPVSPALWSRVLDGAKGRRVREVKNTQLARDEPSADTLAVIQRGMRLDKSAPKPAFLRVNDSPDADTLVTEIVFTHR